ncbi:MAG TPA: chemotaxis protein CheX [Terriglobales bacterium]|nr:chemotaxis protein CheX [Terriglobales bacterium]
MTTIRHEDMLRLSNEIWDSMLGLPVLPQNGAGHRQASQGSQISAFVQITGAWQGTVRLDCSAALARIAAARFLGLEPPEVSPAQARDAIGELTNMSAGSVKSLVPGPSHLSLPSVTEGSDYQVHMCREEVLVQTSLLCQGESLVLTVWQKQQSAMGPGNGPGAQRVY